MNEMQYPVQNMYYNFVNMHTYMNQLKLTNASWEYFLYFKDFMDIKVSMFTYENLPEGITSEILETALLLYNNLCLYYVPGMGKVVLGYFTWSGKMDYYLKPMKVNIMSFNGQMLAKNVDYKDIVLVRDNACDVIPFLTLNQWIEKIWSVDKTLEIALSWIRFPKAFEATKDEASTIKTLFKKACNFEPVVIVRKGLVKEAFPDHDFKLPTALIDIYDLREKYRGLALASMGIYNVTEKRERDVAAVTAINVDYQNFVYQEAYNQRRQFVKLCNEKFGTNIVLKEAYVENAESEANVQAQVQEQLTEATQKEADTKVEVKA